MEMKSQFKAWALENSKGYFETVILKAGLQNIVCLYGEGYLNEAQKEADKRMEFTGHTIKPVSVIVTVEKNN